VIRQAIPGFAPLLERIELLEMAAQEDVESRLVLQDASGKGAGWKFKHGPFARKALPPFKQAGWTLLVQGVDMHDERVQLDQPIPLRAGRAPRRPHDQLCH
jgi:50S ribosomal protein L16 3-hydroxylase